MLYSNCSQYAWFCSALWNDSHTYVLIQSLGERVVQPPLNIAIPLAPPQTPSRETGPHNTCLDDLSSHITNHHASRHTKCPNLAAKRLMVEYTQSKASTLSKPSNIIDLTTAADSISTKKLIALKTWVQSNLYSWSLSVVAKERILSPTSWLTDGIIKAAQHLTLVNIPLVWGLQPPCLGKTCSFMIETGEFIQILHKWPDHLLVLSHIGVLSGNVVIVYDSKYQ